MTKPLIRAIATNYNGYLFRSRTEARWAVFFDTLGVTYEYEKEGYYLDGIKYLPDFWLPEQDCWVEIKGSEPLEEEVEKAKRLTKITEKNVYLFYGSTPLPGDSYPTNEKNGSAYAFLAEHSGYEDYYVWCECPDCGKVGIRFDGRADRLLCKQCYHCAVILRDGYWHHYHFEEGSVRRDDCPIHGKEYSYDGCSRHGANLDKGYNAGSPRLIAAYKAARQADFDRNGLKRR